MAIFETFYLAFKADSSQLKKEVDDVKKKTGELTDTSKKSEDQAKKTDNEFTKLAGTLSKVAAGYFSIGAVVGAFKNTLANTANIGNLSRNFGLNPEEIDAYRKVFRSLGYDAEAATSELLAFSKAWNFEPNAALAFLPSFADQIKSLPSITLAQRFGEQNDIGPEIISIIYNEKESTLTSLAEEQKRLGVLGQQDVDIQREFNKSVAGLSAALDAFIREMNTYIIPALSGIAKILTPLVYALENIVKVIFNDFFGGIGELIGEGLFKGQEFFKEHGLTGLFKGNENNLFKKNSGLDFSTDFGFKQSVINEKETLERLQHQSYVPTVFPSVSNSQASIAFSGDINVNTTAQDAKGIANSIVGELGTQSKSLFAQLQQSNAYYDDGVVI